MHPILKRNLFLVKEHVGFMKAANNYDVYDPATAEIILHCREPHLGTWTKLFRLTDWRQFTPFDIHITTVDEAPVIRVTRSRSLFLSQVHVYDGSGVLVGGFKQKFSIGGAFTVVGPNNESLCELKGRWSGFNYKFMHGENVLAEVTKKWTGIGQELFTTADNYVLQISDSVPEDNPLRLLIVAAVFCIDMVLKEK
jgi:uncharacterized protein YxjI